MLQALSKKSKNKSKLRSDGGSMEIVQSSSAAGFDPRTSSKHRKTNSVTKTETAPDSKSTRTRSASSRRSCSAMVTFESMQPTQVWQASSASPSPPIHDIVKRGQKKRCGTDSLNLSMMARVAESQWMRTLSIGDEDASDDSSDDWDAELPSTSHATSSSSHHRGGVIHSSSLSSSDTSSSMDITRPKSAGKTYRRRNTSKKTKSHDQRHRHRRSPVFSTGSSSSSSLSGPDNEFDLCWKAEALKADVSGSLGSATPIQTPQLMRTPQLGLKPLITTSAQQTPQLGKIQRSSMVPGSPFCRPQTLAFPRTTRNSSHKVQENVFTQSLSLAIEDFFPTPEWIEKYKVIVVNRGDYLRIIPYPGTNPETSSPTSGWHLAQKWCTDHKTGTGPIGFVPRIVCKPFGEPEKRNMKKPHFSPRRVQTAFTTPKTVDCSHFMTTSHELRAESGTVVSIASGDVCSEPMHERLFPRFLGSPEQIPSSTTSPRSGPEVAPLKTSFGSGASIAAVYEIEDRDSGRGPSSGSEWSSGKAGSLSGATDLNIDEKDQLPTASEPTTGFQLGVHSRGSFTTPRQWASTDPSHRPHTHERRASLDQYSHMISCPLPPPPMALLGHVVNNAYSIPLDKCAADQKSMTSSIVNSVSDTEASIRSVIKSKLYVRDIERSDSIEDKVGDDVDDENDERDSPPTVVVPSNSDPAYWEPYKTMIQVGQNKLEKFTLV